MVTQFMWSVPRTAYLRLLGAGPYTVSIRRLSDGAYYNAGLNTFMAGGTVLIPMTLESAGVWKYDFIQPMKDLEDYLMVYSDGVTAEIHSFHDRYQETDDIYYKVSDIADSAKMLLQKLSIAVTGLDNVKSSMKAVNDNLDSMKYGGNRGQ